MDNPKERGFRFIASHSMQEISKRSSVLLRKVRTFDGGMKLLMYYFYLMLFYGECVCYYQVCQSVYVRHVTLSYRSVCICKACDYHLGKSVYVMLVTLSCRSVCIRNACDSISVSLYIHGLRVKV
jgi:hypothetical protein